MHSLSFDNTYARLPERFYARIAPTKVREPRIIKINQALAGVLGIDPAALASAEGAALLAGNRLPEHAEPIALAYAGHQFGAFVPQLGDGRAILLGEVLGRDGVRRDIQLKGAGRTPFSRGGDGRAALGPVLREYIVSEAMAALGVPTTRALAAVMTGEPVLREERLPGAVLTRVAASHLRVGTFEFFAARRDRAALAELTRYALARHFPERASAENAALALLEQVIGAQAALVARWLGVGFVHGVMNTDNTSISGETIDYGPCAFLDEYDPRKRFSSIDHGGRYAFGNQPAVAQWNLTRFAETLLPLLADDEKDAVRLANERLERFPDQFEAQYFAILRAKLGLAREEEADLALLEGLLERLAAQSVDYTLFFRRLSRAVLDPAQEREVTALFAEPAPLEDWLRGWRQRLERDAGSNEARAAAMQRANPALIPRNHRIQEAIDAAVRRSDFAPFETLVRALEQPYLEQPELSHLSEPPRPEQRVRETFCGT